MAFLNETYDVATLPQGNSNYEPVPEGWYMATITSAELKDTANGTGQYIKLRYDITGPAHQGRVVFGNINIRNASAKAEEIGRQQLGDIMRAIGIPRVTDTDQLIGGNVQIKVSIRQSEQYGAQNEIKGWKAINGSAPSALAAPAAPASNGKAAPPWAKK